MPELPEVEVIRLGLAPGVTRAIVTAVDVFDARALKRHVALGDDVATDFERRLIGARMTEPKRRGKFLWIPLENENTALLGHLGMSGQLLLRTPDQPDDRHVRVRLWLEHPNLGELRLDFSDQRLFGSLAIDTLSSVAAGDSQASAASCVPSQVTHIARDPLDPAFSEDAFFMGLRRRNSAIKRVILDQALISGVGNIYADEALWDARIHPETRANLVGPRKARQLLTAIRTVFSRALAEGGTSFDALYVNVNGESGYFAHSLNAYGRTGEPCSRCAMPIKRVAFANRGSHFCPRCQRKR